MEILTSIISHFPEAGEVKKISPLNDCARFSLLEAVSCVPKAVTYGLAAVSRKHIPVAIIKKITRYAQYSFISAAGKKSRLPAS